MDKIADEPALARWRELLKVLQREFPSPWRDADKDASFESSFNYAIRLLDQMKHPRAFENQNAWQGYLGDPALPDYSRCHNARIADTLQPLNQVIKELVALFSGMPNWNHPQTMTNVIPPANTAAILGSALAAIFSPNLVEGEYSWNIAKTEIESAAMVADLIGWDPRQAGGIYTFGGSGCYLYATKLALTKVLGADTRKTGVRVDGQVLVSSQGHYARQNATDWTGLGMDNVRSIEVDEHNRMRMSHLREVMAECRAEGKPVVMVVCTMGTTDAFAIDPIAEVRALVDGYENAGGHPKPLIYADAVIGWSWVAFSTYDFVRNPLQFSPDALVILEENYREIAPIRHADAIGIDFHKTGWAPYNSSLFLVRAYDQFVSLMARPMPPYLQDRTPYNPFQFTLETSRTGAYSMAGWATLRLFGREGFQVMLGRIIEVQVFLRKLLVRDRNLVCVNPDNCGFVTLFRVYPRHIDAEAQYRDEIEDPARREELRAYNLLQQRVANKLFAMLRDPAHKVPGWENPPYMSFTIGFRPTNYAPDEPDPRYRLYALKTFPMSPNSNELSMLVARNYVLKARDLVIEELLAEAPGSTEAGAVDHWWGEVDAIPRHFLVPRKVLPVPPEPVWPGTGGAAAEATVTVDEILAQHPLLAHLSREQHAALLREGRKEHADAGEVLFRENDRAETVYLILRGSVRVFRQTASGESEIATLAAGEIVGEMALFEQGQRSAAVQAIEPSMLFAFSGQRFLSLVLK